MGINSNKKEFPNILFGQIRSPYVWGFGVACIAIVLIGILPLTPSTNEFLSPGPVASAHAGINSECGSCHSQAFTPIKNDDCSKCHRLNPHTRLASFKENEARCVTCHVEHKEPSILLALESEQCIKCHGDIKKHAPESKMRTISNLKTHPDFTFKEDASKIKLNHAVHLKKGIRSPNGPVDLTCVRCHRLDEGLKKMKPVTFDHDCRSCHPLTFDDRLSTSMVPHGDVDAMYRFLLGEYFRLHGSEDNEEQSDRRVPGSEFRTKESDARIVEEARKSEEVLVTKTGCNLCHMVSLNGNEDASSSRYEIEKPNIPSEWLKRARFSHSAHQSEECESCHKGTRNSEKTSDVLMPAFKDCKKCHVQKGERGAVPSDCSLCHPYHRSVALRE